MGRPFASSRALATSVLLFSLLACSHAFAQRSLPDDPYRYDLRTALFPVAFVAGVSQSSFGSGLRGELDLSRRLELQLSGRLPWLTLGSIDESGFALRAGLAINFVDEVELTSIAGTVHPEDAGVAGGRGIGTDSDLMVPTGSKLGSPRMVPTDRVEGKAPIRHTQSLRLGWDFTRAVENARPAIESGLRRHHLNTLHALYLGYSWGAHWNISPATAGKREVGWRHFYADALLTLKPLVKHEALDQDDDGSVQAKLFPVGLRIGLEGAMGALIRRAPGVGFGYTLELGALPGYSGVEGYLMVGLGLALDMSTGAR